MPEPMRTISIKIPGQLDRALGDLARRRNASRSAVLREALHAFAHQRERSVAARARDLAGSVLGPRDLSTSHKHLSGYGR
jgi:predicted transcriptional regulator